MIEEPYRWVEAIANRREYIEDQLASGSPVVLAGYDDGLLFFTVGRGTRKVFEIYDRIGFAALGHPADIERMRLAAIDLAHVEGFNRAATDVSLRRLVSYSISPALKTAFEQIYSAPHIVKMIMAELNGSPADDYIVKLDYDGSFARVELDAKNPGCALAGRDDVETVMNEWLSRSAVEGRGRRSFEDAVKLAARAWAVGMDMVSRGSDSGKDREPDQTGQGAPVVDPVKAWAEQTKGRHLEAAALERSGPGTGKFRWIEEKELRAVLKDGL